MEVEKIRYERGSESERECFYEWYFRYRVVRLIAPLYNKQAGIGKENEQLMRSNPNL